MRNLIKLFTTLSLIAAGCFALDAQTLVKVSGIVTSSDDGLPMIGVAVMDGSGNGVITSLDGDYMIEVTPGTELTFSSIGFVDAKVVVPQSDVFTHNVQMQPESTPMANTIYINSFFILQMYSYSKIQVQDAQVRICLPRMAYA